MSGGQDYPSANASEAPEAPEALVEAWAWTALALAVGDRQPPPALRQRLIAGVTAPPGRFAPFAAALGELFDLRPPRIRELLASLVDPQRWVRPLGPGIELFHLAGGPATAGADVGLVRMSPGTCFPDHRHLGDEWVLILQGVLEDRESGRFFRPGEWASMSPGTTHTVCAHGEDTLVYAVVVFGVEIFGVELSGSPG